jgi:hypothetical protein
MTSAVLAKRNAGRNLTVLPDDLFVVSYYRSGTTWSRFLVANLLDPNNPVTFENVWQRVPPIYLFPDRVLRAMPRVLMSHESFDPRYPRVLYIVRDPRDVAVSFYYYALKMRIIADGFAMDDFVTRFIKGEIVPYANRVGCWEDHVLSWIRLRRGKPGFCMARYEDLQADTVREITKWLTLLRVNPSPTEIEQAVNLSSANTMRLLEEQQSKQWHHTKKSRQDIRFVRAAKTGGWQQKLSQKSIAAIEEAWGATMEELGYELTTRKGKLDRNAVLI